MSTRTAAVLGALALCVSGLAVWLVATSDRDVDLATTVPLAVAIGLTFVAAGIVAVRRRPDNRSGLGLVRGRLAQTAVGRLVVELGDSPGRDELRQAIRRSLGDPSLTISFFDRELRSFVDEEGRPIPGPAGDGLRFATIVERRGEPVAALVHDASLLDNRGLLDAVTAAARLALEHERNLEELRRSEARQRALLNAMPDLMLRMGMDGTYLAVKAESSSLLVMPEEELVGASMHDVLPREVAGAILGAAQTAQREGGIQAVEYQLELEDELRDFEGRVVVVAPDEFLLIVRDFTERKRYEAGLRRSRARIVEAGDSERRRLERNLHDGAQQRLVSTLLSLRVARSKLASDPTTTERLLDQGIEELTLGLDELRELARGIHPAILTDLGLDAALRALAARSPVPVALEGCGERLPAPVEAAAYYVVSEALTNIVKYASAEHASVRVARANGRAVIEVADDGVGGADPSLGSGLRGLADRVEALNGRLVVESEPGRGTRVRAEIPVEEA